VKSTFELGHHGESTLRECGFVTWFPVGSVCASREGSYGTIDSGVFTTWQEEETTPALMIRRWIEPLVDLAFISIRRGLIQVNGLENAVNGNFASLRYGQAGSGH
jgi:hypothetical protein